MHIKHKLLNKHFLVAILSLFLQGCGGLHNYKAAVIDSNFKIGDYCQAAKAAVGQRNMCPNIKNDEDIGYNNLEKGNKQYDLLSALNGGTSLFALKQYDDSMYLFNSSDDLMASYFDSYLDSSARMTASVLANESILDYRPFIADNLFLSSYKILNALALKDKELARVEVKKSYEKQKEAALIFKKQIEKAQKYSENDNKQINDAKGIADQKTKLLNNYNKQFSKWNAYKDYLNPYTTYLSGLFLLNNSNGSISGLEQSLTYLKRVNGMAENNKNVKQDYLLAKDRINGKKTNNKYVWVIYENGMAANFTESRIDIPVWVATDRMQWVSFAMAYPNLRQSAYNNLNIYYDDYKTYKTEVLIDVDKTIISEYNKLFPSLLTKAMASTVAKSVAQYIVTKEQGAGAGLMMGIYTLATTTADLRSWHTLPKNVQVARINLKNDKTLKIATDSGIITEIEPPKGKNSIVYVRIPDKNAKPSISLIEL